MKFDKLCGIEMGEALAALDALQNVAVPDRSVGRKPLFLAGKALMRDARLVSVGACELERLDREHGLEIGLRTIDADGGDGLEVGERAAQCRAVGVARALFVEPHVLELGVAHGRHRLVLEDEQTVLYQTGGIDAAARLLRRPQKIPLENPNRFRDVTLGFRRCCWLECCLENDG